MYFENYLSVSVRQIGLVMHPSILLIQVVPQRHVMRRVVVHGAWLRILLVKVRNCVMIMGNLINGSIVKVTYPEIYQKAKKYLCLLLS